MFVSYEKLLLLKSAAQSPTWTEYSKRLNQVCSVRFIALHCFFYLNMLHISEVEMHEEFYVFESE